MSAKVILDSILSKYQEQYPSELDEDEVFEIFCAETILKNYGLSFEEIEDGCVDGENDGGIDAVYTFIDGHLITEDTEYASFKDKPQIRMVIIQSTRSASFKEAKVNSFSATADEFFEVTKTKPQFSIPLNNAVHRKRDLFCEAVRELATKFPDIYVEYYYCSKGASASAVVDQKAASIGSKVEKLLSAKYQYVFLGAGDLYKKAGEHIDKTFNLKLDGSPLVKDDCYVALAPIEDFIEFLSDGSVLSERLFEFNVRDYEGDKGVNLAIKASLKDNEPEIDFWWLNNGITMLADEIRYRGGALQLKNPLIVNGLQTSNAIFSFRNELEKGESRSVLIRAIEADDEEVRDQIIKATNSQTTIKASSLRATDPLQREIEQYLLAYDIYYDRRKNYYKNKGKAAKKIINIDRIAQTIASIIFSEAHTARGRPANLIINQAMYGKLFNSSLDLAIYRFAAKIYLAVDNYFRVIRKTTDNIYTNNLKFHCIMVTTWDLMGQSKFDLKKIIKIVDEDIDIDRIERCFNWVQTEFDKLGPEDKTAKDKTFTDSLKSNWDVNKTKG